MEQRTNQTLVRRELLTLLAGTVIFFGLSFIGRENYPLFHSLVELFGIFVAFSVFSLTLNARRFIDNSCILFIGLGLLFVGTLGLIHVLAFKGIGTGRESDTNVWTQLWIAGEYLQAIALFTAPFLIGRKLNYSLVFALFSAVLFLLLWSVFVLKIFPLCYAEGAGFTPFAETSRYVISLLFGASALHLLRKRVSFDRDVLRFLVLSVVASLCSMLALSDYRNAYAFSNAAGHYLQIISYYLIYRAIVVTGLARPHELIFRDLMQSERMLQESEERYRSLVELSPDAIAVISDGRYVYVNNAGLRLLGGHVPDDLVGRQVLDLVQRDSLPRMEKKMLGIERHAVAAPEEATLLRLDGTSVSVELAMRSISYQGKAATQVVMRDVTMRKLAEEAMRIKDHAIESSINAIAFADLAGMLTYVNPSFLKLWGYTEVSDAIGRPASGFWASESDARTVQTAVIEQGSWTGHLVGKCKDGSPFDVELVANAVTDETGKPICMMASFVDVTERKKAEEALRKARDELEKKVEERTAELAQVNEQLRNLSMYLQSLIEEERTAIARDIHDELGQVLTALKMDLHWLMRRLGRDDQALIEKSRSMSGLIDESIATVKRILSKLRPGVLDDLGLTAAIEWQAEEFQKRTGIPCNLEFSPEDIAIDRDRSTTIFRIFQEALTNVIRHAQASSVKVSLEKNDSEIVLRVEDDGKGITQKQISAPRSFGLIGIRERVLSWGGTFDMVGNPREGTSLTVHIPLDRSI